MPKQLIRYPIRKIELLQAWDAADELILAHLANIDLTERKILILNDSFGALACGLIDRGLDSNQITSYVDSYNSYKATLINAIGKVTPLSSLHEIHGFFDYVLIKVPKNMSFFEDELSNLSKHLTAESKVICGAMVKHLPKGAFDLLNQYIGQTTTSLAQKKARLIFTDFERQPSSSTYPKMVEIEGFEKPFTHHSNLFSREGLDIGTRFFLEHIDQGNYKSIIDLGCANGIIGIRAKKLNPTARLIFTDVSKMAVLSAQENYAKYFTDEAQFYWTNCLEEAHEQGVDLVLCNPPFHQEMAVSDATARSMFEAAFDALRDNGRLLVIGNSHLRYDAILKKVFGNAQVVATNKKFMIVESVKDWAHVRIY